MFSDRFERAGRKIAATRFAVERRMWRYRSREVDGDWRSFSDRIDVMATSPHLYRIDRPAPAAAKAPAPQQKPNVVAAPARVAPERPRIFVRSKKSDALAPTA